MERTLHSSSLPKHWATSPAAVSNKKVDCVEQFRWSGSEPMTEGSIVQMSTCPADCCTLSSEGLSNTRNNRLGKHTVNGVSEGTSGVASEEALTCIVGVIPHTHVDVEGRFKNLADPETVFITFW